MNDTPQPLPVVPPVPVVSPPVDLRAHHGRIALAVYAVCVLVYAILAGDRLRVHSPDNHFAYLADSYLHRTLAVRCDRAVTHGLACPPGAGGNDWAHFNNQWYVAFPSFPALFYVPAVAILGREFPNRILDVLMAGVAPALLFLFLEHLHRKAYSDRSLYENLGLTALFAFGSVYFFSAVQGSVWFTAHVVACALAVGFLAAALEARRPLVAGLFLGLLFHTRTSMLFMAPFFALEVFRTHRRADWPRALRAMVVFALPVLASIGVYMALNKARFHNPMDPGYQYLQIRWQTRILRWGLFNYHYLSRNLAVALCLLPWITRVAPFIQVSRHGLALWVTTPHFVELARPVRTSTLTWSLGLAAGAVALIDLLYQNTGWVQFGYRFSNDYAVLLVVLVALTGRPWKRWAWVLLVAAIAVNAFGAATFDRNGNMYAGDNNAEGMFQPD